MKNAIGPKGRGGPDVEKFDIAAYLATPGPGRAIVNLKAKSVLFSQGDACNTVFYLHKGCVTLTVTSRAGKEAAIALLSAGEFAGAEAAISPAGLQPATATAITAVNVLRIDRAEMLRILHEERSFSDLFISFLISRSSRIQDDLVDQLFNSSEKRLARLLLLLGQFGNRGEPEPCLPKISQQVLAELIGTTRPRVSFFMKRFRELGFIEYKGRITVNKSLERVLLQD